jgi:hypothetical protein
MDLNDLAAMGITFDEENNTVSFQQAGQEPVCIQMPEGVSLDEFAAGLMNQMDIMGMNGTEACAQVREDINMVDDALIDMIENDDPESQQVAVSAIAAATQNIVLLTSSVCENEQEEQHVEAEILKPLLEVTRTLAVDDISRDSMINIAASWLPVRAAVEAILDEVEG